MKPIPVTFTEDPLLKSELATFEDGTMYRSDLAPGTAKWTDSYGYLNFVCPCGCGAVGVTIIRGRGCNPDEHPSWEWDGDTDEPTLTPSIQRNTPCRWHGFMERGFWCLNRADVP